MPNYQLAAERAARKHRINPRLFKRQIGAESNFNPNAGSPAGAQGIAQFMPATATGMGVDLNDGRASDDLDGAATLMSRYLKQYGGSWKDALTAYNAGPGRVGKPLYAETAAYVAKILNGKGDVADTAGGGGGDTVSVTPMELQRGSETLEVADPALLRKQFFAQWLAQKNPNNPLLKYGGLSVDMPTTREVKIPTVTGFTGGEVRRSSSSSSGVGGRGKVVVAPGANRKGVGLQPLLTSFVGDVAGRARRPVHIGTGTNHNQYTVNGNISDHWDGHGADVPVPVDSRDGDLVAAHALQVAGISWGEALRMARRGGLFNVTPKSGPYKGKRVQVIWRTDEGGNHHDHVHIGIR